MKCRNVHISYQSGFLSGLFCSNCLGMNFAECCTNDLGCRICMNCKNIKHRVYKRLKKCQRLLSTLLIAFVIFS